MKEDRPTESDAKTMDENDFSYEYNGDEVISYEDVIKARDDDSVQILDIRPKERHNAGHIPKSIHMEATDFFQEDGTFKGATELKDMFTEKYVDLTRPIVFTCENGTLATVGKAAAVKAGATGQTWLYDGSW